MPDFLGCHRRAAISGCAGSSGKTTLAVEKARRLAGQDFQVLLSCFNVNLAEFLRSDETLPKRLDVVNSHRLASNLCRQAALSRHGCRNGYYFDQVLLEQMMEAVDRLGSQTTQSYVFSSTIFTCRPAASPSARRSLVATGQPAQNG